MLCLCERISIENETGRCETEFQVMPTEEQNLRTKRLASITVLIYGRQTNLLINEHLPRISPILKPRNFLLGLWLDLPLFALLAH